MNNVQALVDALPDSIRPYVHTGYTRDDGMWHLIVKYPEDNTSCRELFELGSKGKSYYKSYSKGGLMKALENLAHDNNMERH
jgi:hypothetical protein